MLIRERIAAANGFLSFAEYMQLALHEPGLGYYAAGARKLGADGDFITAPEISPLFARALASQAAEVLEVSGGDCLELGPGSGRLAADLLLALQQRDRLPERYLLLETSPDLRERQRQTLAQLPPALAARCVWIDRLPLAHVGLIFGNEVLDALPVERLRREGDRVWQIGAGIDADGKLVWRERLLAESALRTVALERLPAQGGRSEINFAAEALLRSLGGLMTRGLLLLLDYGYPAAEYYHPARHAGTLTCFYRHRQHDNPFFLPGLQDITAHVDFTAVALAAAEADLALAGYTSQAQFLINCGILDALRACGEPSGFAYLHAANALNRLTHPAEMGELFKAIAWVKELDLDPRGFREGNRWHRL